MSGARLGELRCPACGELIGVMEPLVVVADGERYETSWLSPDFRPDAEMILHAACVAAGHLASGREHR